VPDFQHELQIINAGSKLVAGIDEAGRGPLAGPVTAAAVILPIDIVIPKLDDSKKLTSKTREKLFDELTNHPEIHYSIAHIEAFEIDQINILEATRLAMRNTANQLKPTPSHCLIDGLPVPDFPISSTAIVKGDQKSISIAAASIIAKVTRDRIMVELAQKWPAYGFDKHKGYGTKQHLEAIKTHGPCPAHRKTFKPISQVSHPSSS